MNVVDFGMGMQDAIAAPRVDASGLDTLYGEAQSAPDVIDALKARGHRMVVGPEDYANHSFARPVGVLIDEETGEVVGRGGRIASGGGEGVLSRGVGLGYNHGYATARKLRTAHLAGTNPAHAEETCASTATSTTTK